MSSEIHPIKWALVRVLYLHSHLYGLLYIKPTKRVRILDVLYIRMVIHQYLYFFIQFVRVLIFVNF